MSIEVIYMDIAQVTVLVAEQYALRHARSVNVVVARHGPDDLDGAPNPSAQLGEPFLCMKVVVGRPRKRNVTGYQNPRWRTEFAGDLLSV